MFIMNKKLKTYLYDIAYSPLFDDAFSFVGGKRVWADYRVRQEKKRLLANAKKEYEKGSTLGSLEDYKQALDKHWISYNEYALQYDFPHLSEHEREEFVTRLKMVYFHWRFVPWTCKSIFRNKQVFLRYFEKYIHRRWLFSPDASFEEFKDLILAFDCIVKPCDEMRGKGIFKVKKNSITDIKALYESCKNDRLLVEQCIESCEEIKAFHPQSLNTIRVVTVSNRRKAEVFGSFLRMGVGDSVIDNAHAGGIFAHININNGEIDTDGINTDGHQFTYHPDSKLKIKGFVVPQWDLICRTCIEAAMLTDNTITGWDVIINQRGEVEFVEGNNGPDFDVMQSPLKVGVKKQIYALIKEYRGVELD